MEFVRIDQRKVYEMVLRLDDGREISVEIDRKTRDRILNAIGDRRSPSEATSISDRRISIEYDDDRDKDDIVAEMNDRLSFLGLPTVGEEEMDGVEPL